MNFVFSHMATKLASKGGHRAPAANVPVKEFTPYTSSTALPGVLSDMTAPCADYYTDMGQSYPNPFSPRPLPADVPATNTPPRTVT